MYEVSSRISRDLLYMSIASLMAKRGTCLRAEVGCVVVAHNRIVSTGYVGSPPGQPHCLDQGCLIEDGGCVRTRHAEENAITFAGVYMIDLRGSHLYTTCEPCFRCALEIIRADIRKVIYRDKYRMHDGVELLEKAGVAVEQFTK